MHGNRRINLDVAWLFRFCHHHVRKLADAKALEFLTGYLVEKSLAVDNVFVWLMIFSYFAVPPE